MQAALEALVGPEAKGLSASTVARLKQTWREEYAAWRQRRVDDDHWVYIEVDGIYSGLRAEHHQAVCVGRYWGEEPWGEAVLGDRRRRARIHTELAGSPVESESAGDEPASIGQWRWGHGVLGSLGGSLPAHSAPTLLVPQDEQCLEGFTEACSTQGQTGLAGHLAGGDTSESGARLRPLAEDLCGQISEGDSLFAERSGGAANVLRVSGSSLAKSSHDESD